MPGDAPAHDAAAIAEALAAYDARVAGCPANKTHLGHRACPKCGAGLGDNCFDEGLASAAFISAVRASRAQSKGEE